MLNFFRLLNILFSLTIFIEYTNEHVIQQKFQIYTDLFYQPFSNSSILAQLSVRKSIQCSGQCTLNSACQTATYYQTNKLCFLFDEATIVGQMVQRGQSLTFRRQVSPSVSSTFPISTTITTISTDPLCSTVIPSFGNTWNCINTSLSINNGGSDQLYVKKGITLTINSMGDITAYLESSANVIANSLGNVNAYLGSNATLSVLSAGSLSAYLKSYTSLSYTSGGTIHTYYENNTQRSYTSVGTKTEYLCSTITFDYSNIPSKSCF